MFFYIATLFFFSSMSFSMEQELTTTLSSEDFFTQHSKVLATPIGKEAYCNILDYALSTHDQIESYEKRFKNIIENMPKKSFYANVELSPETFNTPQRTNTIPITPLYMYIPEKNMTESVLIPIFSLHHIKKLADQISGKKDGISNKWKKSINRHMIVLKKDDPEILFTSFYLGSIFCRDSEEEIEEILKNSLLSENKMIDINFRCLFNFSLIDFAQKKYPTFHYRCPHNHKDHMANIINQSTCLKKSVDGDAFKLLNNPNIIAMIADLSKILNIEYLDKVHGNYIDYINNFLFKTFTIDIPLTEKLIDHSEELLNLMKQSFSIELTDAYSTYYNKLNRYQKERLPLFFGSNINTDQKTLLEPKKLSRSYLIKNAIIVDTLNCIDAAKKEALTMLAAITEHKTEVLALLAAAQEVTNNQQELASTSTQPEEHQLTEVEKETTEHTEEPQSPTLEISHSESESEKEDCIVSTEQELPTEVTITAPCNPLPINPLYTELVDKINSLSINYQQNYLEKCIEAKDNYHDFPWVIDYLTKLYGATKTEKNTKSVVHYWPIAYTESESNGILYAIYKIVESTSKKQSPCIYHRGPAKLENPNKIATFKHDKPYFEDIINKALSSKNQKTLFKNTKPEHAAINQENLIISQNGQYTLKDPFGGPLSAIIERITKYCITIKGEDNKTVYFPLFI